MKSVSPVMSPANIHLSNNDIAHMNRKGAKNLSSLSMVGFLKWLMWLATGGYVMQVVPTDCLVNSCNRIE